MFGSDLLVGVGWCQGVTDTGVKVDISRFYSEGDCDEMVQQYQEVLESGDVAALLTTFQCMSLREPLIEIAKTHKIPIIILNSGSREAVELLHGHEEQEVSDLFVHYIGQDDFTAGSASFFPVRWLHRAWY